MRKVSIFGENRREMMRRSCPPGRGRSSPGSTHVTVSLN